MLMTKTELGDAVKALDTIDVATWLGMEKHKASATNHFWRCPSCGPEEDGKGDNLSINMSKGPGAKCYACGNKVFSNQDLVMFTHHVDFWTATLELADAFTLQYPPEWKDGYTPRPMPKATHVKRERSERKALEEPDEATVEKWSELRPEIINHMYFGCTLGPRARTYLEIRGLDVEMCEHFGVVSIEDIEQWRTLASKYSSEQLAVAGFKKLNWDNVYPFEAPFLIFPYKDDNSAIQAMRFAPFEEARKDGYAKYIGQVFGWNTPAMPFEYYNAQLAKEEDRILWVVEGEVNQLSIAQLGECAVAGCGAHSWEEHWGGIFEGVAMVIVLNDPDRAGVDFATRVIKSVDACNVESTIKIFEMPRLNGKALDSNDLLQNSILYGSLEQIRKQIYFKA